MIPFLFVSYYSKDSMLACAHAHVPADEIVDVVSSTLLLMATAIMGVVLSVKTATWAFGPSMNLVSNIIYLPTYLSHSCTSFVRAYFKIGGINPTRSYKTNKHFHLLCLFLCFLC